MGCLLIEIVGLRKIGEDCAETGFDCVAIFGGTQTRKTLLRGTMVCRIRETPRPSSQTSFFVYLAAIFNRYQGREDLVIQSSRKKYLSFEEFNF